MTRASSVSAVERSPRSEARASTSQASRARMRAVVARAYGSPDVLGLETLPRPSPKPGELLIRVHSTNVTAADAMMRRGEPAYARLFLGVTKPKAAIPGTGFSGVVVAVGKDARRFEPGAAVYGEAGLSFGAHADYVCVSQSGVVLEKPDHLSFDEAAAMCDGPLTSMNFLERLAQVETGDRVLVNGAAGSLGTAAVQIARALGAEVTGVCSATSRPLVESLGAGRVLDYAREDFTAEAGRYDVIFDSVGKSSFSRCRRALRPKGRYLSPVLRASLLLGSLATRASGGKRATFDATGLRPPAELRALLQRLEPMVASGALRIVIERTYRLDQIAAAHAHVDGGHKHGNVIIRVTTDHATGPRRRP